MILQKYQINPSRIQCDSGFNNDRQESNYQGIYVAYFIGKKQELYQFVCVLINEQAPNS